MLVLVPLLASWHCALTILVRGTPTLLVLCSHASTPRAPLSRPEGLGINRGFLSVMDTVHIVQVSMLSACCPLHDPIINTFLPLLEASFRDLAHTPNALFWTRGKHAGWIIPRSGRLLCAHVPACLRAHVPTLASRWHFLGLSWACLGPFLGLSSAFLSAWSCVG